MRVLLFYVAIIGCAVLALPQKTNNDDSYDAERRGLQQFLKFDLHDAKGKFNVRVSNVYRTLLYFSKKKIVANEFLCQVLEGR